MASCCSPRRPDEPIGEYWDRCKVALDAWRRQFLDDYYSKKQSRLMSPNSDGLDERGEAQIARMIEQDILVESGKAKREDFIRPRENPHDSVVYPPGKSLSEISGDLEECPEFPDDWPDDGSEEDSITLPPRKKKREQVYDMGTFASRRWSPTPEVPEAESSTLAARKRRRDEQDYDPDEQAAQPGVKRARRSSSSSMADAHDDLWLPQASAAPGGKRKRGSDDQAAHDHDSEGQASPDPRAKRRKTVRFDLEEISAENNHSRSTARAVREEPACVRPDGLVGSPSAPVTRARRRQLSGLNARLFQLGQRGQLSLQGGAAREEEAPKQAPEACEAQAQAQAPGVPDNRPQKQAARIKSLPKPKPKPRLNTTTTRAKARARAGNDDNDTNTTNSRSTVNTKAVVKTRARNTINRSGAVTKARGLSSVRQTPAGRRT